MMDCVSRNFPLNNPVRFSLPHFHRRSQFSADARTHLHIKKERTKLAQTCHKQTPYVCNFLTTAGSLLWP